MLYDEEALDHHMMEEAELRRLALASSIGERVACDHPSVWHSHRANTMAAIHEGLVLLPTELHDALVARYLECLPNRGLCAMKVLQPLLEPFESTFLIGAAAVHRVHPEACLPDHWDVAIAVFRGSVSRVLCNALGATECDSPLLAATDLRVGDKLLVRLHWTFGVHRHILGLAASEVGIAYNFSSRTWYVSPRALAASRVPTAWSYDPWMGMLMASDADLDVAQYTALTSRALPDVTVDPQPD